MTTQTGSLVGGRYRLGREIARGGMGVVCEAVHVETERPVALKLVPDGAKAEGLAEARLRREARALGALQHPGIVQVLDAGPCATSGFFMSMERLEGRTLDGLLAARRKIRAGEALWVVKAVGEALAHAHLRGVVHRDIKPGNIFVSVSASEGERIKLIDFGLAAFSDTEGVPSAKLTMPGDVLGTLEYIAPEQLSHPEVHDPRSDVYALAAVLYECLTGTLPTLADRVGGAPRLLERRREMPDVDDAVIEALIRAMQPKPEERFEDVASFIRALESAAPISPCRLMPTSLASMAEAESKTPTRLDLRQRAGTPVGRRKHPRAPYITPCRIVFADGSKVDGRSEDISVGGMLVVTPAVPDAGARSKVAAEGEPQAVTLRFSLPTTGLVATLPGMVRWLVDGRGRAALGVEFTAPPEDARAAISRYVDIIGLATPET